MKTGILLILIFFSGVWIYSQSNITYDGSTGIEIQSGADVCADAVIINGIYTGGGTICSGPLPVTISSFSFVILKNNVRLDWTTETELNNTGFDVEKKSIKDGVEWKKITFIPGNGTTNEPKSYSFEDKKLQTGLYSYRLKQIDYNGNYEYFELENDVVVSSPNSFSISQNYPNPSNPKSKIDYQLPADGKVTIKLYDIIGREAVTVVNETKLAGYYTAVFDGTNLASGVYFYRIIFEGKAQKFNKTLKMVLVK